MSKYKAASKPRSSSVGLAEKPKKQVIVPDKGRQTIKVRFVERGAWECPKYDNDCSLD